MTSVAEWLIGLAVGRVALPEPIFNWLLRRRVERKGLTW